MVKVERIVFRTPVRLPSGETKSEVSTTTHPDLALRYDRDGRVLLVDGRHFPLEAAHFFDPVPGELIPCPECEQAFETSNALGSHRSYVHKVNGKSRSPEKQ